MLEHYWKNVGTVLLGALAAQLIPIIGALFIVRLYPPTAFGAYSAWLAVVSILAVILTLRYDNALPVEADGFQRQIAVIAVLVNSMFMMVLLLALLPILLTEIRQLVPSQSNEAMWIMLPTALLMATTTVWQGWCAADGDYKTLNNLRILLAALTVVFQVLGSLIDTTELVLSASHLAGLALSQLIYYCIKPISYRGITKKLLLQFWTRRVSFFKFSLPADLISTLTANLPILIVSKRFGPEIAGLLALTLRVLGAPLGILGKAVLDVFKRYAAQSQMESGEFIGIFKKTFLVLFSSSLIFSVAVMLIAERLFLLFFGQDWLQSATYAVYLIPLFSLRLVASPLSYSVYIAEKQHWDMLWQALFFLGTVFSLVLLGDIDRTLILYGFIGALLYIINIIMSFNFSKPKKR